MIYDNLLKCAIVLLGLSQLASCATLRCYNTVTNYIEVKIDKAEDELFRQSNVDYFNINKPTYLFALGYNFHPDEQLCKDLASSLLAPGDRNVVMVNWCDEAKTKGGIFEILQIYINVVPNVDLVGRAIGKLLAKLTAKGMNKDIHFIGFDYGAHLAGYAGRECADNGLQLKEIIALDPTRFGFSKSFSMKPVDKTCASFVSVVHCDVDGYGLGVSMGDVDFWLNNGRYATAKSERRQPGCPRESTAQDKIFGGNYCSHARCGLIYVESLGNNYNFKGGKAENYAEFVKQNGIFSCTNYIGPKVDYNLNGDFFLTTNADSPYGKGFLGLA